jgi:hypothetical protein
MFDAVRISDIRSRSFFMQMEFYAANVRLISQKSKLLDKKAFLS